MPQGSIFNIYTNDIFLFLTLDYVSNKWGITNKRGCHKFSKSNKRRYFLPWHMVTNFLHVNLGTGQNLWEYGAGKSVVDIWKWVFLGPTNESWPRSKSIKTRHDPVFLGPTNESWPRSKNMKMRHDPVFSRVKNQPWPRCSFPGPVLP